MKVGLIDVGGGMRDIFGAGVYEYCLKKGISFDYAAGVSAGAMNLCLFLSGKQNVSYRCYTEYGFYKEYMSFNNFIKDHAYANVGWMMYTVCGPNGYMPMDFDRILNCGTEFEIVATGAYTGKPFYFKPTEMQSGNCWCVIASATLPIVSRPYIHEDSAYYDGGLSNPIPIERCFEEKGCDKVVLILTRPKDYLRKPDKDRRVATLIKSRYPGAAKALSNRAETYNNELALAKKLEEEGKVLILASENIGKMSAVTKDREMIKKLYECGLKEAEKLDAFFSE